MTSQDLRIAELAMKSGCATALVLNKWDLTGGDVDQIAGPGGGVGAAELDRERARVNRKLRLRPKVLTASAVTGRNVRRLLQEALSLSDRAAHRIPTPELNRFLGEVTQARQPPAKQGHRLKMLYMAQIGVKPPRFSIQVNSRARLTRDYAYFVENRLRERYGLDGIPLIIDFAERKRRPRGRALEPPRLPERRGARRRRRRCCWRSRSLVVLATRGDAAPADGAARLVPPDALLYAHLSTSEGRTQDARLLALAGRFSTVRERVPALGAALTPGAANLDFERDVRPWLGEEAAVALLAGGAGPQPMLIAAVDDRAAARRTLDRLGAPPAGSHAGTRLLSLPPRATAAFAGDHLVIGPQAAVTRRDRPRGRRRPALAGRRPRLPPRRRGARRRRQPRAVRDHDRPAPAARRRLRARRRRRPHCC